MNFKKCFKKVLFFCCVGFLVFQSSVWARDDRYGGLRDYEGKLLNNDHYKERRYGYSGLYDEDEYYNRPGVGLGIGLGGFGVGAGVDDRGVGAEVGPFGVRLGQ